MVTQEQAVCTCVTYKRGRPTAILRLCQSAAASTADAADVADAAALATARPASQEARQRHGAL